MVEILRCRQPQDKQSLFNNFDPRQGAWVVPDLQSKWHLQKDLLRRQGVLEQASVWRSTELWSHLSFQLKPDLRILSAELAQTLFWNWIEEMDLSWARSPQAVRVVLRQMQMWMSAFADPRHSEIMAEWFQANPEAYVRWGHWFELCAEIWRRCQDEHLVMATWLPAVLLAEDLSELKWNRELVFDLGPQVSLVEVQLIRELGRHLPVKVLFPEAPWVSLMAAALRPYDDVLPEPYKGDANWQPTVSSSLSFGRFSTQLAEVKDALATVRGWLESGVPAQHIAVVAPDIEAYWPALQLYATEEGLPVSKALTSRLGAFVEMAQWMSTLRTAIGKVSSADLEVSLFAGPRAQAMSFEEFRVLFTHVYDDRDLKRAGDFFESPLAPLPNEPMPWKTFLTWALRLWNAKADTQRLYALLQVTGQEVPEKLDLKPHQWLSYLEGIMARREVSLAKGDEAGIWCVSLSSADWLPVTHAVFLNLSESALRAVESSPVSAGEAQKVFTDTGFAVSSLDRQEQEFELLWFLQRDWSELRLSFAGTDFSGRVLTPSKFWMWAAFANGALKHAAETPQATRWDQIQKMSSESIAGFRSWSPERTQDSQFAINRDVSVEVSSWKGATEGRFSASSLERYAQCPFMFGAERKLKLSDDPVLDLDMDRRTRGRLLHSLAERLSAEPFRADYSEEELSEILEQCRQAEDIRMGDERLWAMVKSQHMRLARLFLSFENEWRGRFPKARAVARELAFECFWDLAAGAPTQTVGPLRFSGRIDRVDQDSEGRYALVDYKASAGGLRNWSSWLGNDDLQMPLYSLLLQEGFAQLPAAPVVAANYYVIKDADRRKGFHLKDEGAELYSNEDRHRNFITVEERQGLFDDLKAQVQKLVESILAGQLNPKPEDERACSSCSWRKLCRAPHLN